MKCYSPISISNKKLAFHSGYDKPKLTVPCNNCEACRENVKNDWIIRTYYHWLNFYENGGRVLFVTLSYCWYSMPWVIDGDFKFMCFSHKDISRFINSVRKFIEVHYHVTGIDYIITCEYGHNGTQRPHYHGLLFFPNDDRLPGTAMLKKIIEYYWRGPLYRKNKKTGKYVRESLVKNTRGRIPKRMGYVYWSKRYGAEVTCSKAAKYVGKYICKDMDFYNKPDIKEYLSIEGNKEKIKDKLPRHWQSKSFGLSMLDYILSLPYEEQLDCIENGISFKTESFRYTLPIYIKNKLFFDSKTLETVVGNDIYTQRVYSKAGLRFQKDLALRRYENIGQQLRHKLSPFGLYSFLPELNMLERWCRSFDLPFLSWRDLSDYFVNTFIKPYDFKDLVAYKLVYRGYAYNASLLNVPWLCVTALTNLAPSIENDRLAFNSVSLDFDPNENWKERVYDQEHLILNYVPQYQKFEKLLKLLEDLECMTSERRMLRIRNDEKDINNIRKDMFHYEEE